MAILRLIEGAENVPKCYENVTFPSRSCQFNLQLFITHKFLQMAFNDSIRFRIVPKNPGVYLQIPRNEGDITSPLRTLAYDDLIPGVQHTNAIFHKGWHISKFTELFRIQKPETNFSHSDTGTKIRGT